MLNKHVALQKLGEHAISSPNQSDMTLNYKDFVANKEEAHA